MTKIITEKQIVDHIIEHWNELFEEGIYFFRKEHSWLEDWRCDITAYSHMELGEEYGFEKPHDYRAPIFMEVKYESSSRDLIYELSKALEFVRRHQYPMYVAAISDDFSDPHILRFILDNGIHMWKISVKDNDINTLTLEYIEQQKELEDVPE